jgi:hypothetical protein
MAIKLFRIIILSVLVVIFAFAAGCATTKGIVSQWSNPAYTSTSFKTIMVIGVSGQTSIRRNFEDEFVAQLNAAGFKAVPSYRYIPENEKMEESKLKQMAQQMGADAAIITRLAHVEQRMETSLGYYSPFPAFGFYGWSSFAWYGWYPPPRLYRYDVYTSETTLYDVAKNEVIWTGTINTTEADDVSKAIKTYVETVIKALDEKNILKKRQSSVQ